MPRRTAWGAVGGVQRQRLSGGVYYPADVDDITASGNRHANRRRGCGNIARKIYRTTIGCRQLSGGDDRYHAVISLSGAGGRDIPVYCKLWTADR